MLGIWLIVSACTDHAGLFISTRNVVLSGLDLSSKIGEIWLLFNMTCLKWVWVKMESFDI